VEKKRDIREAISELKQKIGEIERRGVGFPLKEEISFSIDKKGNIISISNVADSYLFTGRPFLSFIDEEDRKKAFSYFIECISGREIEGELNVRIEGERKKIEFIASPIKKDDEVVVEGIAREKEKTALKEFNEFLSFLPEGGCITDLLGNIIACNEILANLIHYSISEIQNKNIFDFIDERDAPILREQMGKSLEKNINEWEAYIVTREEIKIPVEMNIKYMGEKYNLFFLLIREIAKRKEKEKILKEEKEKEGISLPKVKTKLHSLAKLNEKLYGSHEEIGKNICKWIVKALGMDSCSLFMAEDDSLVLLASEGKKGRNYYSMDEEEYAVVSAIKNGKEILVSDFSKSSYQKENEWSKSQLCIPFFTNKKKGVLDVQSKKEIGGEDVFLIWYASFFAERAFQMLEISSSLQSYERIIKKSVNGIYRVTMEGELLEANPAFMKIFGLRRNAKDINVSDFYANKEDRKKFLSLIEKKGMVKDFEILYKRSDGKEIICKESAWLAEEGGKKIIEGMIEDISEHVKARQDAQFYNSLLRHDIYNKNEVAMGYLGLIKNSLPENQAEIVEKALLAIMEGNKLIETVKKLERTTEGGLKPLDVGEVIEKVIERYEEDAKSKDMEIVYEPIKARVKANDLIEDAFSNLIKNSIEHSYGSRLEIFSEDKNGMVDIYIKDDGIGIPAENKEKIFKQGWKGKGSKGSGLGLYLVKKIIEGLGGNIKVESDEGACFIVSLKKYEKNTANDVVGRESEFFRVRW